MSLQLLQCIREYELSRVLPLIPSGSTILEVGAGAGWQAKVLAEKGFSVVAIDSRGSLYAQNRVWPIIEYDGINMPFLNNQFDVVFSSNVLEHIFHAQQFQAEIKRVLKPGGIAIHVLPTASWRFWTNVCHYPYLAKRLLELFFFSSCSENAINIDATGAAEKAQKRNLLNKFRAVLLPSRHGEEGNCVSEIYLFSRFRWIKLFQSTGWVVEVYYPNRLFYTGYSILALNLSLRLRHLASYMLGSSCQIFRLRKAG